MLVVVHMKVGSRCTGQTCIFKVVERTTKARGICDFCLFSNAWNRHVDGYLHCKRRMQIYFQLTLELTEAVAVSSKIVAGAAFRDFDVFVLVL